MSITKLVNESNVVFNVEKVKANKAPRHFFDADRESKDMLINGKKTRVAINRDRTQYVLFQVVEPKPDNPQFIQSYYVRDHKFFDNDKVKSYVKPSPEQQAAEAVKQTAEPAKK